MLYSDGCLIAFHQHSQQDLRSSFATYKYVNSDIKAKRSAYLPMHIIFTCTNSRASFMSSWDEFTACPQLRAAPGFFFCPSPPLIQASAVLTKGLWGLLNFDNN